MPEVIYRMRIPYFDANSKMDHLTNVTVESKMPQIKNSFLEKKCN